MGKSDATDFQGQFLLCPSSHFFSVTILVLNLLVFSCFTNVAILDIDLLFTSMGFGVK